MQKKKKNPRPVLALGVVFFFCCCLRVLCLCAPARLCVRARTCTAYCLPAAALRGQAEPSAVVFPASAVVSTPANWPQRVATEIKPTNCPTVSVSATQSRPFALSVPRQVPQFMVTWWIFSSLSFFVFLNASVFESRTSPPGQKPRSL